MTRLAGSTSSLETNLSKPKTIVQTVSCLELGEKTILNDEGQTFGINFGLCNFCAANASLVNFRTEWKYSVFT